MAKKTGFFSYFSGQSKTCLQFCEKCNSKYICISCDLQFESNSELWLHYLSEISIEDEGSNNKSDNKKPCALCPFCNNTCVNTKPTPSDVPVTKSKEQKYFYTIPRLRQHLKAKHGMVPCDNCHEVFYTEVALNHHFKANHQSVCIICNAAFADEEAIELHNKLAHLIQCPKCDMSFTTEVLYRQHFNNHLSLCFICNEYFPDDDAKNKHIMLAHKVCCALCKKYFNTKTEFKYHYNDFHRISCNLCKSIFPDVESLTKHKIASHNQV